MKKESNFIKRKLQEGSNFLVDVYQFLKERPDTERV